MQNFKLKEFVEQNIHNFNPKDQQDLIKAEKLLKAESKLNQTFSINEIEAFLDFIKNQTQNFDEILKLPVIKCIYTDIYPHNLSFKPDLRKISKEELEDFSELFTPNLKAFISEAVRKNQWQSLIYFQQYYAAFFSVESLDFYKNLLHDRNHLIIEGILKNKDLVTFKKIILLPPNVNSITCKVWLTNLNLMMIYCPSIMWLLKCNEPTLTIKSFSVKF